MPTGRWRKLARKDQLPPKNKWNIWLILAGRGFGKTRAASEAILELIAANKIKKIGLLTANFFEAKEIMLLSDSGLLKNSTMDYNFIESAKKVEFANGAVVQLFSANAIESLRGFEFDLFWIDEFAKLTEAEKILNQVFMCLRKESSKLIITTTPHNNVKTLKEVINMPGTHTTYGSSFDNKELSDVFFSRMNRLDNKEEIFGQISDGLYELSLRDIVYKENSSSFWLYCLCVVPNLEKMSSIILLGVTDTGEIFVLEDWSTEFIFEFFLKTLPELHNQLSGYLSVVVDNSRYSLLVNELIKEHKDIMSITLSSFTAPSSSIASLLKLFYTKYKIFHHKTLLKLENEIQANDGLRFHSLFLGLKFCIDSKS